MAVILTFFVAHWILSVFFQSFFQHRYAAHRMYTMGPRTEKVMHLLTYLVQGASYLSPRGYAILHRSIMRSASLWNQGECGSRSVSENAWCSRCRMA